MKQWHDEGWLREKYHEDDLYLNEIADICGVTEKTIQYWFDKHDIERESRGTVADGKYTSAEWLHERYYDDGLSLREIANECDVTKTTIRRWFDRHDLDVRDRGRQYEDDKWSDEAWVRKKYVDEEKSIPQIADICDTSSATICRALNRFGIGTRSNSFYAKPPEERSPKSRGAGWKRGKRIALERADYACENPDCNEDAESLGQNPDVHHVVPFRLYDSDEEANDPSNLIALCRSCHFKLEPRGKLLEPIE